MTHSSWSRVLVVRLQNSNDSMIDTEEVRLLFQLLRLGDPYISSAWHSIWHGLEKTPSMTRCLTG